MRCPRRRSAVWPDATRRRPITRSSGSRRRSCSHGARRAARCSTSAPASMRCSAVPTLPDDVPVVRLEDAGMARADGRVRDARGAARVSARRTPTRRSSARPAGRRGREREVRVRRRHARLRACSGGRCGALSPFGFPLRGLEPTAQGGPGRRVLRRRATELRAFLAAVARAGLPAAVDPRDARPARPRGARAPARRRARRQCRPRRPRRRRATSSRCSTAASWPARRSTCSARSRCRRAIRSGIIRGSRSRRTSPPSPRRRLGRAGRREDPRGSSAASRVTGIVDRARGY